MREVVIASGVRTPIGAYCGMLREVPVEKLAALVLNEVIKRAGVKAEEVDEVILSQSYANGESPNLGRLAPSRHGSAGGRAMQPAPSACPMAGGTAGRVGQGRPVRQARQAENRAPDDEGQKAPGDAFLHQGTHGLLQTHGPAHRETCGRQGHDYQARQSARFEAHICCQLREERFEHCQPQEDPGSRSAGNHRDLPEYLPGRRNE